jgi:hypothetical protein
VLQAQFHNQLQDVSRSQSATIRFPDASSSLEEVAITAAPGRIKNVAKALLDLVPLTFELVGEDPRLAQLTDTSDFHYAVTDQLKLKYLTELKVTQNFDNSEKPPRLVSSTFRFQYFPPNLDRLKEAIPELCQYISLKGAVLEQVDPPDVPEPTTKPYNQTNNNQYDHGIVAQPYHTQAQINAAAQGYQINSRNHNRQSHNNYRAPQYHPNQVPSLANGHPGYGYGRGGLPLHGALGHNRGGMNGLPYHPNMQYPTQYNQSAYPPTQSTGPVPSAVFPPYHRPMDRINGNLLPQSGYFRRYDSTGTPPVPDSHVPSTIGNSIPFHPQARSSPASNGIVSPPLSALDTLGAIELPEINTPSNNNGGFRPGQDINSAFQHTGSYVQGQPSTPNANGFPSSYGVARFQNT